ncbi:MAG: late competence development ComFB family protein [Acetobacterium sp.]
MIKNYMEEVVDEILPAFISTYSNVCTCENCLEDMKAMALNHLTPCYIVTKKGLLFTKVNEMAPQFKTDVIKELTKAMVSVTNKPRHS